VSTPIPIGPSLSRIGQIFVNVKDFDRAIAFYRDVLGMKFLFQAPPNMAFFDCDGIRLMLGVADRPELDHPASIIYYKVDDIERVYEIFKARGAEFLTEPKDHGQEIRCYIKDPDGHLIEVGQSTGILDKKQSRS